MAIPYSEQSWVDGSGGATPLSAARLNWIEVGIGGVSFAPTVRVYNNANININTATLTALTYNSERFDTAHNAADTMHDTGINTGRLTCRYAGKYQITSNVDWAGNVTGTRVILIRLNGVTTIAREDTLAGTGGPGGQSISTLYDLAVNDYVETVVYQTSGAGLNVNATGNFSPEFMMVRVA